MSTSSLRRTLADHADDVADTGVAVRLASVHHRIGVARRRRRAAAVAGAAFALVAAAGVVAVPLLGDRDPQPADHPRPTKLVGWRIPATETIGVTPYRFREARTSAPGQRQLTWDLPASGTVRSLTSATSRNTWGPSVLHIDGLRVGRTDGGVLNSGYLLGPGEDHRITLTLKRPADTDRLGLAVYDQAGDPPAGVTNGVTTYRREIAHDRLLGAQIGRPGQRSVEVEVTVPSERFRISDFCYGAGDKVMVTVKVDGHPLGGSGCQTSAEADPGKTGAFFDSGDANLRQWGIRAGSTITVTATLGRWDHVPVGASGDRAVIGVGVYALGPSAGHIAGWDVLRFTEGEAGTEWEYVDHRVSRAGARELVWRLPTSDVPRRISFVSNRVTGGDLRMDVDGEPGSRFQGGAAAGGDQVLAPGRAHVVRLVRLGSTDSPRAVFGLVLRRLAD